MKETRSLRSPMLTAHLSHVALGAADPEVTSRFYEDHAGLARAGTSDAAARRLHLGLGAHVLELHEGAGLHHFALEVPDPAELDALAARLREHGVSTTDVPGSTGHPPAVAFTDPDGHRVELHGRIDRSGEGLAAGAGRKPVRLHHIPLSTPDVPALVDFYVSVLGFVVSDTMGDRFMWLRCNREHHTVAIVEGPAGGLDHYCFEVLDWDDLKRWCDELAAGDVLVSWGPGRHGPGNNLFIMFDDPDGVHVELSCEMERFWDGGVQYPGPRDWAPEMRTVNLWGPAPDWRRPLERAEAIG
jgi:catechol 2,3-dioxygenase-like lactoylglutathione lyase family enzyme